MIRGDYSYLLDNLKQVASHYYFNNEGLIVSYDGRVEKDFRIVINAEFYNLYRRAYKELMEKGCDCKISENNRDLVNHMLMDYDKFNYFINTCIGEYQLYNDIGTGKVSYIPYQSLADFFFKNDVKKGILKTYLKVELKDTLEMNQSFGKTR